MSKEQKVIIAIIQIIIIIFTAIIIAQPCHRAHLIALPSRNRPIKLIRRQDRIHNALNIIGEQDGGKANVTYNRNTHVLKFIVLNIPYIGTFKAGNVRKQANYFKSKAGIAKVIPKVVISHSAQKRHAIQIKESQEQHQEDIINAQKNHQNRVKKVAKQKAKMHQKNELKKLINDIHKKKAQQKAKQNRKNKSKKGKKRK